MSRIGKQPIVIPEGVKAQFDSDGRVLTVSGPHGELTRKLRSDVEIKINDKEIVLSPRDKDIFSRSLWGTYASHTLNMIEGVTNRFEKKLVVEGVGYKVEVIDKNLVLKVGFSHPVEITIPAELEVSVEKNTVSVKGVDKELVGSFSANIRSVRKPEPYKGKGVRYANEVIRRKQGKRAA